MCIRDSNNTGFQALEPSLQLNGVLNSDLTSARPKNSSDGLYAGSASDEASYFGGDVVISGCFVGIIML